MTDEPYPTLDALKARGDAALGETRRGIADLYRIARDSRSTVYKPGRWSWKRPRSDAFAKNANDLA